MRSPLAFLYILHGSARGARVHSAAACSSRYKAVYESIRIAVGMPYISFFPHSLPLLAARLCLAGFEHEDIHLQSTMQFRFECTGENEQTAQVSKRACTYMLCKAISAYIRKWGTLLAISSSISLGRASPLSG